MVQRLEVKRIEEQKKQRDIERKRQLEIAEKINRKFKLEISKPLPVNTNVNSNGCNNSFISSGVSQKNNIATKSESRLSTTTSANKVDKQPHSKVTKNGENSEQLPNKLKQRNVTERTTETNDSRKKVEVQRKPSRLSFAEMMELAKKNVQPHVAEKRPFDDLIPCSVNSKYRKLDSQPTNPQRETTTIPSKKRKSSPVNVKQNPSKVPPGVTSTKPCKSPGLSNDNNQISRGSVMERTVQCLEKKNQIFSVPSKTDQKLLGSNVKNQPSSVVRTESTKAPKVNLPKETQLQPKGPTSVKSVNVSKPEAFSKAKPSGTNVIKQGTEKTYDKLKAPSSKPIPVASKSGIRNQHSTPQIQKPRDQPQYKPRNETFQRRGISAQLGVNLQPQHNAVSDSEEEDDYLSDDSFIDDSEALQSKEYARVVRDIHRALKFDPRKYKDVNPYEDLRCMEAKYCDIEKEERRR
ncbi:unnamed protein product [Trichobilharzia regenti]|nr:unnamed protein product [Trichobilharzia regenti]